MDQQVKMYVLRTYDNLSCVLGTIRAIPVDARAYPTDGNPLWITITGTSEDMLAVIRDQIRYQMAVRCLFRCSSGDQWYDPDAGWQILGNYAWATSAGQGR